MAGSESDRVKACYIHHHTSAHVYDEVSAELFSPLRQMSLQVSSGGLSWPLAEAGQRRITDLAPADVQPLIPAHWRQFPPVSPLWNYTLGAACAGICECCQTTGGP